MADTDLPESSETERGSSEQDVSSSSNDSATSDNTSKGLHRRSSLPHVETSSQGDGDGHDDAVASASGEPAVDTGAEQQRDAPETVHLVTVGKKLSSRPRYYINIVANIFALILELIFRVLVYVIFGFGELCTKLCHNCRGWLQVPTEPPATVVGGSDDPGSVAELRVQVSYHRSTEDVHIAPERDTEPESQRPASSSGTAPSQPSSLPPPDTSPTPTYSQNPGELPRATDPSCTCSSATRHRSGEGNLRSTSSPSTSSPTPGTSTAVCAASGMLTPPDQTGRAATSLTATGTPPSRPPPQDEPIYVMLYFPPKIIVTPPSDSVSLASSEAESMAPSATTLNLSEVLDAPPGDERTPTAETGRRPSGSSHPVPDTVSLDIETESSHVEVENPLADSEVAEAGGGDDGVEAAAVGDTGDSSKRPDGSENTEEGEMEAQYANPDKEDEGHEDCQLRAESQQTES